MVHKIAKLLILFGDEVPIAITGIIFVLIILLVGDQIIDIAHRLHLLGIFLLNLPVDEDDDGLLGVVDLVDRCVITDLDLGVALGDVLELVEVGIDAGLFLVAV